MANPVTYAYQTWQPDATDTDSNHPITALDPMSAGSSNDAAGWVRLLESQMRRHSSVLAQWEQWVGIKPPYAPSPNPPVTLAYNQFTMNGDWTSPAASFYPAIIFPGRRVKAYTTGHPAPNGLYGTIMVAVYSTVTQLTTVTVLWDGNQGIDASLTEVQFGTPAPGTAALKFFKVAKLAAQNFSGTSIDTDFTFPIIAYELWNVRLMLFGLGGAGGQVTITPLVPTGAGYRAGIQGFGGTGGQGSMWVSSGGLTVFGNSNYWTIDVTIQTAASGGTVSFQYSGATTVAGVDALSTMIAEQLW